MNGWQKRSHGNGTPARYLLGRWAAHRRTVRGIWLKQKGMRLQDFAVSSYAIKRPAFLAGLFLWAPICHPFYGWS